ncbi:uncharacterized protein Z520_05706 [Fonsecaea multimorphosa CBS 102226]|uniref:Ketoreductase (KR) domain-containing protein n=1 Tax=Fonsecaea multimorphosa CBS 102226 TaxID=1442371 RepID=A0A0D2H995_9EURO|nr:uncharacterized protein Z520_05706 [Fonsecaea multimorphosa CBS 102226]KIX98405.1 hypothetical protein Z520_05706 [Fonsecaea multimorphosa CBS 102226]OAL24599.1 hypothetical protein AYO22_05388 [Fonsecaea multimorphosa]
MPCWVITGADRGIGYEFVRKLSPDPDNIVVALVLSKKATDEKIAKHGIKNVHVLEADVTDRSALLKAAEDTEKITGGKGVDYFINNAGLIAKPTAFRTLEDYLDMPEVFDKDMHECFSINAIGTMNATAAFIPLIRKGTVKKVVALSSGMGELEFTNELDMDMAVPYSISKAAMNMVMAKFSASYKKEGILFMAVSPGAVDSEDDGRGSYAPVQDVEGDLSQKLYPVRPWHKEASAPELQKRKEQGMKFQQYEPTYTTPLNTQESVEYLLKVLSEKSIENGDAGAFISHLGTKRWL